MVRTLATETVSLPTSHISPASKHSVYPSIFFFFLTPLVLRIVPGREQSCLGNGGILSFEGKKRYILKSNSLSKSKKVPHSKRLKWD